MHGTAVEQEKNMQEFMKTAKHKTYKIEKMYVE